MKVLELKRCATALLILVSLPCWAGTWNPFGPKNYVRGSGAPVTVTDTFSIRNPNTQYTLHLQNGGLQDDVNEFVSNTVITVNGVTVVAAGEFTQATATLDRAVQLQAGTNTIAVQVRGKVGGQLAATIIGVDNDLPTIHATASPAANAASWNNTAVTVSFQCDDATSGVASCSSPVTVTTEGAGQVVTGKAVDLAGNVATTSVTLNIDLTPPTITPNLVPPANSFGWNNTNVTVNFVCADALSGVASCSPPASFTAEGAGQTAPGTATDKAGNSTSTTATVNIDKTPPTISATVMPAPDAHGIVTLPSGGSATVSFTCADSLSGVASCPATIQVSTPGANQQFSGTAADKAGNNTSTSVTFSVEAAPLTITPTPSPAPNGNGWNNTPVTISYQCSGGVPPVQCPASQTISSEGANQAISATATDAAGQSASASTTLNIDLTPPVITATVVPSPNPGGIINATSATVTFNCSDALSGVATCPSPVTTTTTGLQTISGTAVDKAGNTNSASIQFTLQPFPPLQIVATASPASNSAGWNNTPVTVTFSCSGGAPPVSCPGPQTLKTDGANQKVTGTATDAIGDTATASVTINLDQTPPLVSITSPADGSVSSSANIVVSGLASDGLSGLATVSCNGTAATISGGNFTCPLQITQGSLAVTVTASDVAGNNATASITANLQGPKVTITSPAPLALFNAKSITVTGTVDDPAATLVVNGVSAANNAGAFTAQGVVLREGNNVVTATATNAGGAVGSAGVSVILDTTPPIVVIDSPTDGAVVTSPQVYVTGMVNDVVPGTVNSVQVAVTVNGVQASVANRSFMAEDVLLVPGKNVITAVATDRAGNISQSQSTVTLVDASTQQRILMVSGNAQTAPAGTALPQPLVVQVVNSAGQPLPNVPVTFAMQKSDGQLAAFPQQGRQIVIPTDANGQTSATLQLGTRVGNGNNQVMVTSPGFIGQVMFCETSTVGAPTQIHDIAGEAQKGITGQPLPEPFAVVVFDANGNPVAGVPVIFKVEQGGGTLEGNLTVTKTTDSDGRATVVLVLAQQEGINNNVVSASFAGLAGPPASFVASGVTPGSPANTTVSGIVLDNGNSPLVNVTASIQGTNLTALTDSTGRFKIVNAPVGSINLFIDGSTSTANEPYPFLEFPLVTVAGQDNHLSGPIFLPDLDLDNSAVVGGDQDVTLTMKGVPGVLFTVFAHSATFPDGSKVGKLSVSQVHPDKVPMPPPNATSPKLFWTVQPPRVKFNPPMRIVIPNSSGMAPGAVSEIFCYNHDLEEFASGGTARVSEDGSVIVSDPGSGVIVSGWGDAPPPPPPTTCADGCKPANDCNTAACENGVCVQHPTNENGACGDNNATCGQGVCTGGECVAGTDGQPCTPDDKCLQNPGKCEGAKCESEKIELKEEPPPSLGIEFKIPDELISGLNDFLHLIPGLGGVNFEEGSVTPESEAKDCCSPDTGVQTGGEASSSAEVELTANIKDVPLFGAGIAERFPFRFPGVSGVVAIVAGVAFNTDFAVHFKGGHRTNSCTNKDCLFGSVDAAIQPGIKLTITNIDCISFFGAVAVCVSSEITPGQVEADAKVGARIHIPDCDTGIQGFISLGNLVFKARVALPHLPEFNITFSPQAFKGITCSLPGGCHLN
jgi:hypothetical protein